MASVLRRAHGEAAQAKAEAVTTACEASSAGYRYGGAYTVVEETAAKKAADEQAMAASQAKQKQKQARKAGPGPGTAPAQAEAHSHASVLVNTPHRGRQDNPVCLLQAEQSGEYNGNVILAGSFITAPEYDY